MFKILDSRFKANRWGFSLVSLEESEENKWTDWRTETERIKIQVQINFVMEYLQHLKKIQLKTLHDDYVKFQVQYNYFCVLYVHI